MKIKGLLVLIFLTACSPAIPVERTEVETPVDERESLVAATIGAEETAVSPTPTTTSQVTTNPRFVTDEEYIVSSLIPFDGIRPIYEPVFVTANEATYQDDELVMGVAFGDEAKAYPVTVLRFREMVNDELAGIPILVTW